MTSKIKKENLAVDSQAQEKNLNAIKKLVENAEGIPAEKKPSRRKKAVISDDREHWEIEPDYTVTKKRYYKKQYRR